MLRVWLLLQTRQACEAGQLLKAYRGWAQRVCVRRAELGAVSLLHNCVLVLAIEGLLVGPHWRQQLLCVSCRGRWAGAMSGLVTSLFTRGALWSKQAAESLAIIMFGKRDRC